ncbi:MAG: CDP-diacylglycerol--serine O-phosphatidyltransferase [Paludibacteraceae bacterium]|nr:CDP-diacylglycerol--serine O-phosphatidyltransferase [Paludibacteraceae bacterium]
MNKIIKSIPNGLTCTSLFFGCLSVLCSIEGNFLFAMICILIGSVFDFSDGFAARALHASSPIGKELDSLADQVSFGVAPGFAMFYWMKGHANCTCCEYLPYIAFMITAFSALRLAKFNVDERQTTSFIGLATPANAMFLSSLIATADMLLKDGTNNWFTDFCCNPIVMTVITIVTSLLLVSEIPMFSLKIKHWGWKENERKFILVGFGIIAIAVSSVMGLPFAAVFAIILFYIAMCFVDYFFLNK